VLTPGDRIPDFALPASDGRVHNSRDLRGRRWIAYFYPKDRTPGCTREACAFAAARADLGRFGVGVLGISGDSAASKRRFAEAEGIRFPLLADEDRAVARSFGAWGKKTLYGRTFEGILRCTFLIGPDGRIERVWPKVNVDGHIEEVLAALRGGDEAPTPRPAPRPPRPRRGTSGRRSSGSRARRRS